MSLEVGCFTPTEFTMDIDCITTCKSFIFLHLGANPLSSSFLIYKLYILTSMVNKCPPLGYLVSNDILQEYTQKLTANPMSDLHVTAYAKAMAIINAKAINSGAQWVTSDDYKGIKLARFLQISGGGSNEWSLD